MPKSAKSEISDPTTLQRQSQTGERIKAIREISGLNQTDMAELCGADQSQWSRWERGTRPAEVAVMIRFASRAQTSLDLIYEGRPIGTHPALLQLLRLKIPHLVQPDSIDTAPDTGKALELYRTAIHRPGE